MLGNKLKCINMIMGVCYIAIWVGHLAFKEKRAPILFVLISATAVFYAIPALTLGEEGKTNHWIWLIIGHGNIRHYAHDDIAGFAQTIWVELTCFITFALFVSAWIVKRNLLSLVYASLFMVLACRSLVVYSQGFDQTAAPFIDGFGCALAAAVFYSLSLQSAGRILLLISLISFLPAMYFVTWELLLLGMHFPTVGLSAFAILCIIDIIFSKLFIDLWCKVFSKVISIISLSD